jgi:hypothetical protein
LEAVESSSELAGTLSLAAWSSLISLRRARPRRMPMRNSRSATTVSAMVIAPVRKMPMLLTLTTAPKMDKS